MATSQHWEEDLSNIVNCETSDDDRRNPNTPFQTAGVGGEESPDCRSLRPVFLVYWAQSPDAETRTGSTWGRPRGCWGRKRCCSTALQCSAYFTAWGGGCLASGGWEGQRRSPARKLIHRRQLWEHWHRGYCREIYPKDRRNKGCDESVCRGAYPSLLRASIWRMRDGLAKTTWKELGAAWERSHPPPLSPSSEGRGSAP